jgi:D-glycero-D-manno-heptose 1,7-bisphosphate phosphatase
MRPAVFLDRDGTIIEEREYLADPEGVTLLPGAAEALRVMSSAGYALVVVTNQSGIARGYFDDAAFRAVQHRMETLLAAENVRLDGVYMCPHHPAITGACSCRKPGTALFRQAAAELGLDLVASIFAGDRLRDVLPAAELGGRGILVLTGYGREEARMLPPDAASVADLGELAAVLAG